MPYPTLYLVIISQGMLGCCIRCWAAASDVGGSDTALTMVAALAVFPAKREVEPELSMLKILRAITSPAPIIIS